MNVLPAQRSRYVFRSLPPPALSCRSLEQSPRLASLPPLLHQALVSPPAQASFGGRACRLASTVFFRAAELQSAPCSPATDSSILFSTLLYRFVQFHTRRRQ